MVLNERIELIKNRHQSDLERREDQSKEQALLRMEMQDEIKSLREKLRTLRDTQSQMQVIKRSQSEDRLQLKV
jgi:hypothetical protein